MTDILTRYTKLLLDITTSGAPQGPLGATLNGFFKSLKQMSQLLLVTYFDSKKLISDWHADGQTYLLNTVVPSCTWV